MWKINPSLRVSLSLLASIFLLRSSLRILMHLGLHLVAVIVHRHGLIPVLVLHLDYDHLLHGNVALT